MGEMRSQAEIVKAYYRTPALADYAFNKAEDHVSVFGVQVVFRFVQKKEGRALGYAAGDIDPLELSPGELSYGPLCQGGKLRLFQCTVHGQAVLPGLCAKPSQSGKAPLGNSFPDGKCPGAVPHLKQKGGMGRPLAYR